LGTRARALGFNIQIPLAPGRRTIAVQVKEPGKGFDQTASLEGQLAPDQTRTLALVFERSAMGLGRRKMSLRWVD